MNFCENKKAAAHLPENSSCFFVTNRGQPSPATPLFMFIIHPGADLCQRPGLFHKPKAAGNPAAFLHRETLLRRKFLNPCRLRHTETLRFSLWPAATTGLRRTPADGISASLKCGRNLRFPHKRPLPGTCSLFSFHFARQGHKNQGIPAQFLWVAREPPAAGVRQAGA